MARRSAGSGGSAEGSGGGIPEGAVRKKGFLQSEVSAFFAAGDLQSSGTVGRRRSFIDETTQPKERTFFQGEKLSEKVKSSEQLELLAQAFENRKKAIADRTRQPGRQGSLFTQR